MMYGRRSGVVLFGAALITMFALACSNPMEPTQPEVPNAAVIVVEPNSGPPDECFDIEGQPPECYIEWVDYMGTSFCPPPTGTVYDPDYCILRNFTPAEQIALGQAMNLMRRADMWLIINQMLGEGRLRAFDANTNYWGDAHHRPNGAIDPSGEIHLWAGPGGTGFGGGPLELLDTLCHEAAHAIAGTTMHNAAWAYNRDSCRSG